MEKTIKRPAKSWGGSLGVILGKYVCEEQKIEEDDEVIFEIKEVIKSKKKKK